MHSHIVPITFINFYIIITAIVTLKEDHFLVVCNYHLTLEWAAGGANQWKPLDDIFSRGVARETAVVHRKWKSPPGGFPATGGSTERETLLSVAIDFALPRVRPRSTTSSVLLHAERNRLSHRLDPPISFDFRPKSRGHSHISQTIP